MSLPAYRPRKLRNLFWLMVAVVVGGLGISLLFRQPPEPLPTAARVELKRYAGKWFEIARFPQFYEEGCQCTTAEYTLHPEGYVTVFNRCLKAGKVKSISGKAFVKDAATNAKLKVQFFWPMQGDYWILKVADDYRYAVVGDPTRETLWMLSRTPQMAEADYQEVVEYARSLDFPVEKLERTIQTDCTD